MSGEIILENLKKHISGRIIIPKDPEYDRFRSLYNATIDKRPALFVVCKSKQDVVHAIQFAQKNNMETAIKAGGHNAAGLALVENGLVIDLSEMKSIKIDPKNKTALVEPGNTLSDVDKATHSHGMALPLGVNGFTGISGLTLGGGIGFLTRKAGLTIDHLLEAEVVLASGKIVTANEKTNKDLFWAIRGGGGNFGVVVSFTFSLLEISNVFGGPMLWHLEDSEKIMRFYDQFTKEASQDLYGFFAFLTVPEAELFPEELRNKKMCGILWSYTGQADKADEIFLAVREYCKPVVDFVGKISLPALNSLFDWAYPPGLHWYWKGHYMNSLSDGCIHDNIKFAYDMPTPKSTMHLYPIDGKAHEIGQNDTAWAHRDTRWVQVIIGVSENPDNTNILMDWGRKYYEAMAKYSEGGGYVNFMMHEKEKRVRESYKENYSRLQKIKKRYDPENFFHFNQNIKPLD